MTKRAQLGMAMFLIADGVFFLLLFFAALGFGGIPPLATGSGGLLTGLVLVSALSIWRSWRWMTVVFGAAFLITEIVLFGTRFMLPTIHGLHILVAVIAVAAVPTSALRAMALWWYFLAVIWIVMLALTL